MNQFLVPLLNYLPITDERGVLAVKCHQPNVPATLTYTPLSEIQWESPDTAELTQSGTVKSVNAYHPLMCRPIRDGPASKCWATKEGRAAGGKTASRTPYWNTSHLQSSLPTGFNFTKWIFGRRKSQILMCFLNNAHFWPCVSMSNSLWHCRRLSVLFCFSMFMKQIMKNFGPQCRFHYICLTAFFFCFKKMANPSQFHN